MMIPKIFPTITLILAGAIPVLTTEIPSTSLEKHALNKKPEITGELIETHAVYKKNTKPETVQPVYRGEQAHQGRANIEPVRPKGSGTRNDPMLADQPNGSSEMNKIEDRTNTGYGFVRVPMESYPDVAYAPGYTYDTNYAGSNSYEIYENPNNYLLEPDTSTLSLLWSQVPDSRTFVSYIGRTVHWVLSSIFVVLLGSLITLGVCTYTNLCTITFHGVGPIHEEMRALMSPERLEKISTAADFVKTAIDKYQKIQKVDQPNSPIERKRRAIFF